MPTTTATTETPDPPSANPPLPAVIADDLGCAGCGYNLRTLPSSSACPECGTPVADAVQLSLRFRDRDWLQRARHGAVALLSALAAAVLYILLALMLKNPIGLPWVRSETLAPLLIACASWAVVGWLIGSSMIAADERRRRQPAAAERARLLLAIGPFLTLVAPVVAIAMVIATDLLGRGPLIQIGGALLVSLAALCPLIGPLGLAVLVRELCDRLEARGLAAQARWVLRIQRAGTLGLFLFVATHLASTAAPIWALGAVPGPSLYVAMLGWTALSAWVLGSFWKAALLIALYRRLGRLLKVTAAMGRSEREAMSYEL